MSAPLRIIFMGTAELACPSLEALTNQPTFEVAAVVTQPDRPKGRDLLLAPSPVKQTATKYKLPVLQPERARNESFIHELQALSPDLIVAVAYGQILPQAILNLPRHGCLNVHASLLPKYRGAAPIQWAILEDEKETGITIMRMDAGLDTGVMLASVSTAISEQDNAETLHDRLAQLGAELLVRSIPEYVVGKIRPVPQPSTGVTYARKITKEDGRIDWNQPAHAIWNRIRAFIPWPGAFTLWSGKGKPQLLKIWAAEEMPNVSGEPARILGKDGHGIVVACGQGALRITSLQVEGGRRLSAEQFLSGHALREGEPLGR